MRYADCKKYMRRIQRAGCTCRSTGTADAVLVKHQKHGLPGNDDAIRAVKLIVSKMADAVIEANQGAEMTAEEAESAAADEAVEEA